MFTDRVGLFLKWLTAFAIKKIIRIMIRIFLRKYGGLVLRFKYLDPEDGAGCSYDHDINDSGS